MKIQIFDLFILLLIYYQVNSIEVPTKLLDVNGTDLAISDQNKNKRNINESFVTPVIIDGTKRIPYQAKNKSEISWINITIITILIAIIFYIVFYLFRYYRKKKYQNPSFYYKITEELFDDITPIE